MKTLRVFQAVLVLAVLFAAPLAAQEGPSAEEAAMMEAMQAAATPGSQHAELAETAGSFKTTTRMWGAPGEPPVVNEGTAERTMILGGRVLQETFKSTFMGTPYEGFGLSGYDNVTGKHWGTWSDNISTGVTLLEGTMDAGKAVYEGETSNPMTGTKTPMRIEIRYEDGKETHQMYQPGPDGKNMKTMEIVYERIG